MKIPDAYTATALALGLLTFTGANASAVTNLDQQGGDYVGELDPRGTFDFISLPIDGAVSVNDIEGCEFEGPPRAYGYNGGVYRKNVIHGSRGNIVPLESSCEFNIDKDDIMYSNEPRDINSNEWVIFSPTEQRKVENLEDAVEPCQLNGVDGVPTYQVDMSGNNAKASGSLKPGKSYWLRLQGQDCAVDFLESTTEDISVQIDTPSEELVTGNTYELTVSADSESEGMSRIELNGEDITGEVDSKNEGNPCIKQRIVYSCEKTFQYTPESAGPKTLVASAFNLDSMEERERIVLGVDSQDGGDTVDEGSDTNEAGAVGPEDASYRFYLANGDKSKSFSAVNDLNTYDQDIEFLRKGTQENYSLIFRVESYDTDEENAVDIMGSTRLLVNTPKSRDTLQNQCDPERGLPYRCAAPRYPSEFQPGEYVVKVKDKETAETFAEKKVTLPAFVQGGL
jgi:hypothetical protein